MAVIILVLSERKLGLTEGNCTAQAPAAGLYQSVLAFRAKPPVVVMAALLPWGNLVKEEMGLHCRIPYFIDLKYYA